MSSQPTMQTSSDDRELPLREQLRWLAEHWRPYRAEVPGLLALTLLNALLLVVYPVLLKRIIDTVEQQEGTRQLLRHVGLLLAFGLAQFAVYSMMQGLRARLNMRFEYGVRLRAFEYLCRAGSALFARLRTGDLITRLTDDVNEKLSWYMCSGVFRLFEALAILVFGVSMMLWIDPQLTLYCTLPLPVLVLIFIVSASRLHERYAEVQRSISDLNAGIESCFSGIRVVKAFVAEGIQQRAIEASIAEQRRAELRAVRWQTVMDSLYGHIWQLAIGIVLLGGGSLVISGRLTIGELLAFDSYVLLLVWPMFDIGQFLVRGRQSAVVIGRIEELEEHPPAEAEVESVHPETRHVEAPLPPDLPAPRLFEAVQDLRFENVSYRYPDAPEPALVDLTFTAADRAATAIVGPIGSGKSTLLAIIPRLIEPDAGQVWLAGRRLQQWPVAGLRQAIGYVPQEAQLLSGTVRENILFGRREISDDDLEMAIEVAQLQHEIASWARGLETVIGPRGTRLSGGQKQRVALARALAGRPSLLLLDDCTASLDAETEHQLWQQLLEALPDCTVLLVTHRPSTLQRAAQILVLDQGRLREQGRFGELNRPGTFFHRLYVQWQLEEFGVTEI